MAISTWDTEQEGLNKKTWQIETTTGAHVMIVLVFIVLILSGCFFYILGVFITHILMHIFICMSMCKWVQVEVHARGFGRLDHKKSPYQVWKGKAGRHGHK